MISHILSNTPVWVWGLLLALLWLGYTQTKSRTISLSRVLLLPGVMTGLSLAGVLSSFGVAAGSLAAWTAAIAVVAWLVQLRPIPMQTSYDNATRRFHIPGSWVPMLLIIGIFSVKYVAGAMLAMQPTLARASGFALSISLLYGAMSGIFVGRAARLWKLAKYPGASLSTP